MSLRKGLRTEKILPLYHEIVITPPYPIIKQKNIRYSAYIYCNISEVSPAPLTITSKNITADTWSSKYLELSPQGNNTT